MLTGSCLCGSVAYEVDAGPGPIVHCHCATCRKAHGSAFSTVTNVPHDRFRWTRGESLIRGFESSPGKKRYFCTRCGSHIVADAPAPALSCCGWDASTRRSPSDRGCISGDRMPRRGSIQRTRCRNGLKARRRKVNAALSALSPARYRRRARSAAAFRST